MKEEHHDDNEPIHLDDWDPTDADNEEGDVAQDNDAFIATVEAKVAELRALYVESPRDQVLAMQFQRLLAERDSGIDPRRWAGIVVTANSGAGKTRMIKRFLGQHPLVRAFGTEDSNFVHIDVPSPVTNKSLGLEVLRTMYPQKRAAQAGPPSKASDAGLSDIWTEVRDMAVETGVWGLWIDEAHDLRNGGPMMHDILQSTIKR